MSDAVLEKKDMRDYIRVDQRVDGVDIYVCRLIWNSPYEPVDYWERAVSLDGPITDHKLRQAIAKILKRRRYFKKCDTCGMFDRAGHFGGSSCHACMAEMGVVF